MSFKFILYLNILKFKERNYIESLGNEWLEGDTCSVEFLSLFGIVTRSLVLFQQWIKQRYINYLNTLRDELDIAIIMPLLMFHYSVPVINSDSENPKGFVFVHISALAHYL